MLNNKVIYNKNNITKTCLKTTSEKRLQILYGMTESSPTTFQTMRTDNVEQRCSSVGYPADHVQVKIIDPGTQQIVAHNTPGEICTRGYNTMIAYWDDQDKTNQTIDRDGWLHTGYGILVQTNTHSNNLFFSFQSITLYFSFFLLFFFVYGSM